MNVGTPVVWALACSVLLSGCGEVEDPAAAADAAAPEGGAAFQGCGADVPDLVIGEPVLGDAGLLSAAVLEASPLPPRKYGNDWTFEIAGASGEPLGEVSIDRLETFMPLHGHPGTPEATFEPLSEPAQFAAVLSFSMRGLWEVRLDARSASLTDRIVFHVCIDE